jgi:hypothetical protein
VDGLVDVWMEAKLVLWIASSNTKLKFCFFKSMSWGQKAESTLPKTVKKERQLFLYIIFTRALNF